jgi:hypothetical protein
VLIVFIFVFVVVVVPLSFFFFFECLPPRWCHHSICSPHVQSLRKGNCIPLGAAILTVAH